MKCSLVLKIFAFVWFRIRLRENNDVHLL